MRERRDGAAFAMLFREQRKKKEERGTLLTTLSPLLFVSLYIYISISTTFTLRKLIYVSTFDKS